MSVTRNPRNKPAVFLDRDNTIIRNDGDLGDPSQIQLMQGAAMAIASLCGLGFKVIVVTNQGGVARGKYTEEDVDAVHDRLREMIEHAANGARIEAFYFCPYHPKGTVPEYTREHPDRKPQAGMLLRAAEEHGLDLARSWMVGDALRDIEAGETAGCRTVWINNFAKPEDVPGEKDTPDYTAGSLVEAVRIIGSQRHARDEGRHSVSPTATPPSPSSSLPVPHDNGQAHGEAGNESTPTGNPDADVSAAGDKPAVAGPPSVTPAGAATRPFRPYALPPAEPPTPPPTEPIAKVRLAQMVNKVRAVSASLREEAHEPGASAGTPATSAPGEVDAEDAPSVASESAAAPVQTQAVEQPVPTPVAALPSTPEQATRVDTAPPTPASTPKSSAEPKTTSEPIPMAVSYGHPDPDAQHKVLRLILQELRGQRGSGDHTSAATIVAMVLQAIAGVCLLGGLWMGAGDDALFFRWLGAGVIVQLAVIALLLFARSDG